MSERNELGKIQRIRFGMGGYQDACIGVSFVLGGESFGVHDFWGTWGIDRSERAKWTEEERLTQLGEMVMRLKKLMDDAKVTTVEQLAGIPISITFDDRTLKSWRVLKEVL